VKILVVGSGGREHAIAWRLAQDQQAHTIICAPGNPGMSAVARLDTLDVANPERVLALADREHVDLTVIGPELPLSRGVVDVFEAAGRPVVGPTRAAAQLECSKAFAKAFMARHGVPTADYAVAGSEAQATEILASGRFGYPVVLKADGLAAGKGVVVAPDSASARDAVTAMMRERRFGEAGARVVIEQCLTGPELSYFVLSDGVRALPLGSAQDHKRAFDDDEGPNTGGMGAFAPSPLLDGALEARIVREVVEPVIAGMRAEGHPYRGFLYCGLMLTPAGPRVIEFNVRFGDPEAQAILPLVSGPFADTLLASARGDLSRSTLGIERERSVGVVVASGGYPDLFETGKPIRGLDQAAAVPGVLVFHAGTARRDSEIVTSGGRVLTVVGRAAEFRQAMTQAYDAVDRITFDNKHVRRDIGRKALA
jgi:phosphoribosylamine---glycine ligase